MHIDTKESVNVFACDGNIDSLVIATRNSKNIQVFKKQSDKLTFKGELRVNAKKKM